MRNKHREMERERCVHGDTENRTEIIQQFLKLTLAFVDNIRKFSVKVDGDRTKKTELVNKKQKSRLRSHGQSGQFAASQCNSGQFLMDKKPQCHECPITECMD